MSPASPGTPAGTPSGSTSRSGSSGNSGSDVPLGVYVLVAIGALGVVLGLLAAVILFGRRRPILGTLLLALAAVQALVIVGLLRLRLWAWTLTLISYGLSGLFDLITANFSGLVISAVIVLYLLAVATKFE